MRLKTKFTLTATLMVLAVVTLLVARDVRTMVREELANANKHAGFAVQFIFSQAQHALEEAADQGLAPKSESIDDLRAYVQEAFDSSAGLTTQIDASVGYSPTFYEVTIVDHNGVALVSSDSSLPGTVVRQRPSLQELIDAGFLRQLSVLRSSNPQANVYQMSLPFNLGEQPFGEIRIGISTTLLWSQLKPQLEFTLWLSFSVILASTVVAAVISHVTLAPLAKIERQLDAITAGQFDLQPIERGDEFGKVSTKITQVGQQLRGVREIFSSLRDNMNHLMAGINDGLLLFAQDGRAVMATPSVEKFLGLKPDAMLGRRITDILPEHHPLRETLRFEGDHLAPIDPAEVTLNGAGGARRTGVSVQVIDQGGQRMGALLMLRDLESLERIGSHLKVSERLSAIGRVTAGVAHEVKNPLNSMRLWLENLKESLPALTAHASDAPSAELSNQAVKVLDSEIDRLDMVVKTFLNFTRPVEPQLAQTRLDELLREVAEIARPQLEKVRVELRLDLDEKLPPIEADPSLLKQAVLNLVLNASEVMAAHPRAGEPHAGRVTLSLRRARRDSVPVAEIRVADTGPGIPPEHRAKIFQLFFTTRGGKGGSGIGLATTFRIVQLHNGSIDFETEVGRGTTFRIELPLAPVPSETKTS